MSLLRREVAQKDVILKKHKQETNFEPSPSNTNTHPELLYDLCGTIDHSGTLYQGHYVANVKIGTSWYHCNDAFISETTEEDVLKSNEVYMMFYTRRQNQQLS